MTTHKDFKRLVRARMQKTGESYTTARTHFLARTHAAATQPFDYAKVAGRSDATIKQNTGCTWERWVKALDHVEAFTWSHREIARHIQEKYKTDGWWAQTVTVGYERIKGLRAIGQRRSGGFEASKSKTYSVPLARLYRAFSDSRTRSRWLPGVKLTIRSATPEKYLRITWPDQTSLSIGFLAKGKGKSQVAIAHEKLPDQAAASRSKQYWAERLEQLEKVLNPSRGSRRVAQLAGS
jgi:uncharacterized protein YndB with AHSA1/START domain